MAVNLVRREFGTEVTTDSVCVDGYEVENLLGRRRTAWGQPKGFLAEPFIKPPVDVTFMFPFNVCVQRVDVHPKVGSQASTGFEVFAASVAMPGSWQSHQRLPSKRGQGPGRADVTTTAQLKTRTQMLAERESAVFACIGKAFALDKSSSLFRFVNHGYRSMHPAISAVADDPLGEGPGVVTRPLRHGQAGALTNASHLTVRVNSAPGGSVAIKYVQIFGQPSRFCSRPTVDWFLHAANIAQNPPRERDRAKGAAGACEKPKATEKNGALPPEDRRGGQRECVIDKPVCPEDFVDPITNEMMVLPVLLPSGHSVDSETLRRHGEAEACWGRPPNDPFTGMPFAEGRKPLPNVKLKERLDRYLLAGGRSAAASAPIARDVGRAPSGMSGVASQDLPTPASLIGLQSHPASSVSADGGMTAVPDQCRPISTPEGYHRLPIANRCGPLPTVKRRRLTVQNLPSKRKPVLTVQQPNRDDPRADQIGPSGAGESTACSSRTHEQMLTQSLDIALEDALSSLPSFSSQRPARQLDKPTDRVNSWSCRSCEKTLAFRDGYHVNGPLNMYTLPCSHLLCRDCLLPGNSAARRKCTVCDRTFETAEVVKVHV